MTAPELSRPVDVRHITGKPLTLEATAEERKALARRFQIVAVRQLQATVTLERADDAVAAHGRLSASIVQSCAISGEDLPVRIDEPLALRFVPARPIEDEELELEADELDEIPYDGHVFDLGDEAASGPFAALAALKKP